MTGEGTEGPQIDQRLIILGVFALVAVAIVAAILIGRSSGGGSGSTASGCQEVEAPQPKQVSFKAPKQTVKKGEEVTAVVETSCGTFDIALDSTRAPKTVNSFAYLAEKGFYDDLVFHRIAPGFVIQGGDPQGTGVGGPGYTIVE
ncbi:MAG TPA: peptidylprolyl isomerase, partial [Solirubrobacterales bacterium]